MKNKSIMIKFLIPTIILIIVSTLLIGITGYLQDKKALTEMMKETIHSKILQVKDTIVEREDNLEMTKKEVNYQLLQTAKVLEQGLRNIPEDQLNNEFNKIIENTNIAEINLTDNQGVVRWSTNLEGIGFDFSINDQTKLFLDALTNKDFVLAQEIRKSVQDGRLFKYIGVARQDQAGILQIGIEAKDLQELIDSMNIKKIAQNTSFRDEGCVFILNKDGEYLSHPDTKMIGSSVKKYDWFKSILKYKNGSNIFAADGEDVFVSFITHNDYIIAATVPTAEYLKGLINFRNKIIGTILISIIIVSIIMFVISKSIINPIKEAINFSEEIAAGKLNIKDLDIKTDDEVAKLGNTLNKLKNSLSDIVMSLIEASQNLSAYSEELSASAEEGNANVDSAKELIEKMSASIQQISASTQEVSSYAEESNAQTNLGRENMEVTLHSMNEINGAVADTVEVMDELNNASTEIGKMVDFITNIADQTNLLALNAAIEAARAGEHGLGFAVVAEEIRELAEETSKATEDIRKQVNGIQNSSESGTTAIKEVDDLAKEGNRVVRETGLVFEEIEKSSEETANHIQETAASAQSLAENSNDIINSTEDVSNMSNEVTNSSQELAAMAENLQRLIEKFNV